MILGHENSVSSSSEICRVWPLLDERTRRLMAANEAVGLGYGGISQVQPRLRPVAQGHRQRDAGNRAWNGSRHRDASAGLGRDAKHHASTIRGLLAALDG